MTVTEALDAIIDNLTAARADAEKCDGGTTGAPGTRLRKAAGDASNDLKDLRKAVLDARKK